MGYVGEGPTAEHNYKRVTTEGLMWKVACMGTKKEQYYLIIVPGASVLSCVSWEGCISSVV